MDLNLGYWLESDWLISFSFSLFVWKNRDSVTGGTCSFDPQTNLPDGNCVFVANGDNSNIKSSYMAAPFLKSVDHFCKNTEPSMNPVVSSDMFFICLEPQWMRYSGKASEPCQEDGHPQGLNKLQGLCPGCLLKSSKYSKNLMSFENRRLCRGCFLNPQNSS